jgi:hypothetical protein
MYPTTIRAPSSSPTQPANYRPQPPVHSPTMFAIYYLGFRFRRRSGLTTSGVGMITEAV